MTSSLNWAISLVNLVIKLVNSLNRSLLFLVICFNSKIISLFFEESKGTLIKREFSFSCIIIWLLYILSFISSIKSLNVSNCRKYLFSLISSKEYLLENSFWIIPFIWFDIISIEFVNKLKVTEYELLLSVLYSIWNDFSDVNWISSIFIFSIIFYIIKYYKIIK